jgi:uncharacterized membrane protein
MGSYEYTVPVGLDASQVFEYLRDVRNLPHYLPQMTRAEPVGGDKVSVAAQVNGTTEQGEAWLRVDQAQRRLEWGSLGRGDYHGELQVIDKGADGCAVEISLHTVRAEGPEIQQGVERTVAALAGTITAELSAS